MQVSFIYYLFIYSFIVNEQPREDERLREGCLIKPRAKVPPQSESQSDVTKGCRVTQCRTENALFSSEHVIQNRESTSRVRICESLLIPSSTSRWVDSYATQAYRCRICPPFFFLLFFFSLFSFQAYLTTTKQIYIKSLLVGTQRQLCLLSIVSIFYPMSLSQIQKMARIRAYKCAERKLRFVGNYSYKYTCRISKNQVLCSGQEKFTQDQ